MPTATQYNSFLTNNTPPTYTPVNWQTLHSTKRLGAENRSTETVEAQRNEYQRDYDRLIFSSPFRRLQNKTQVFPLPGHVFVHNRLTHSLEVASVGRSLGQLVGEQLCQKYTDMPLSFYEFYRYHLQTVIATACLAHDIGNPPFGHSGEEAIRTYFENITGKAAEQFEVLLTKNQRADFLHFEGNANTFRLLTHERLGLHRLCYSSLASVVKYPCTSILGFNKALLSNKKSGYFDSDIAKFETVAIEFGIPLSSAGGYARHPFVFLTEAADDICYRIIDLEDAHRQKIISFEHLTQLLLQVFDEPERAKITQSLAKQSIDNQRISYLRAITINKLVQLCKTAFMEQEQELLDGNLNKPLLDLLPSTQLQAIAEIDALSVQKIYNNKAVIEVELAGYNVIGGLLDEFVTALSTPTHNKAQKILQLIPSQFELGRSHYQNLLSILDYLSGMTDLYAIDLYRKLKGISI
jgi:dGTPase